MKRKGFTLIELLIVTVVIVTLMGIVFRLANVGSDSRRRAITIRRMQCLENCLSGYYAAYGSYPPVPLQGRSRDISVSADIYGVQNSGASKKGNENELDPYKIHWACRAQPVAALFPTYDDSKDQERMRKLSEACTYYYGKTPKYKPSFNVIKNPGSIKSDYTNWGEAKVGDNSVQLFQFGLMSFLLPRYSFMFACSTKFYGEKNQWGNNNQLPSRLDTGRPYANWGQIFNTMGGDSDGIAPNEQEAGMIANLTSQSVCSRWMPNLKGIVTGGKTFYGVNTACTENDDSYFHIPLGFDGKIEYGELYVYGRSGYAGETGSGGDHYILNCMTVRDGWHMDFYYYSEPPYQNYRLWSAGPNRRTFPPWCDLKQFNDQISTIRSYIADDFVHLSN